MLLPNLSFGPFVIDSREGLLRRDGTAVPLTPKAFHLLEVMVEQPGRLISKDELLDQVWPGTSVEESNIAYHVFALRKALGDTAENARYIETVPKRGYRFIAPVSSVLPDESRPGNRADATSPSRSTGPLRLLPFTRASDPSAGASLSAFQGAEPAAAPLEPFPDPAVSADLDATDVVHAGAEPARASPGRRLSILAVAGLVALGGYLVALSRRPPPHDETPRPRPLTSVSGLVRAPSLSPGGTHVVFTWDGVSHDNVDLYVQQIGAGTPLRVTHDPAQDHSASWSPDGRTLAFLRSRPGARESEVWMMAPLGGSERKITDLRPRMPEYAPRSVSWCPDAQCVLVTDAAVDGGGDAIFVASLSGGEKRQLTHPGESAGDADPVISPDGRWLVFRRDTTPFSGAFYRVPLDDRVAAAGPPVRLTATLRAGKAGWTPDSREILYASRGWLWRLNALEEGAPVRLPFVGQDGLTPVVSSTPEGQRRLVYIRSFADTNVWCIDVPASGVPAPSPPTLAVASTRSDHIPNLSPDEQRLVFSSDRSGDSELWVSSLDGSKPLQLTSVAILPGFPRWSPAGDTIAFHGDPAGRPDVLVVPAAGGTPRVLTTEMPNAGFPSFSRDGQWIYFTVLESQGARIWKIPAAGGRAHRVTANTGTLGIESHDGAALYYVEAPERPSSLWRLRLGETTAVKILDGVVSANFDVVAGGVYYIDRPSDAPGAMRDVRLRYLDFATGRSTTIAQNLGRVGFGLSASIDGRRIFYSRVDSSVNELMLVENFR